jgi:putative transposase
MVALAIRTIFTQPAGPGVGEHVEIVATTLDQQFPAVATLLRDAREDITAFADFPEAHWRKIWSTNPLERLNREVNAAPTSSASSPTTPHCYAWRRACSSRPTTNGRSPTAATSPSSRWPN